MIPSQHNSAFVPISSLPRGNRQQQQQQPQQLGAENRFEGGAGGPFVSSTLPHNSGGGASNTINLKTFSMADRQIASANVVPPPPPASERGGGGSSVSFRSGRMSAEPLDFFASARRSNSSLDFRQSMALNALDLGQIDLRNIDPVLAKKMLEEIRQGADIKPLLEKFRVIDTSSSSPLSQAAVSGSNKAAIASGGQLQQQQLPLSQVKKRIVVGGGGALPPPPPKRNEFLHHRSLTAAVTAQQQQQQQQKEKVVTFEDEKRQKQQQQLLLPQPQQQHPQKVDTAVVSNLSLQSQSSLSGQGGSGGGGGQQQLNVGDVFM